MKWVICICKSIKKKVVIIAFLINVAGGFVLIDGKTFKIKGNWEAPGNNTAFGYDFWYQPRHNVMVSSEWGEPQCFLKGFDPSHVAEGKYGRHLHVWDWTTHKLIQDIDLGMEGLIPLELRFLHDPNATEGYVGAALSTNIFRFYKNNVSLEEGEIGLLERYFVSP